MRIGMPLDLDIYALVLFQCIDVADENTRCDIRKGCLIKVEMYVLKDDLHWRDDCRSRLCYWCRYRCRLRFYHCNRFERTKGLNFADRVFSHIYRFLRMTCHIDLICLVYHIFCSIKFCRTFLVFAGRASFIQSPISLD